MSLTNFCHRSTRNIWNYNIFDTNSTDESIIRIQRRSTRVYILTLSLAMVILIIYTTLRVSSSQFQIENPSLSTYFYFYNQYQNIKCPCQQFSTTYSEFVRISTAYHQICTSQLTTNEWITFLFDNHQTTSRYAADFRATASHQFQTLKILCDLSKGTIENGIQKLYNNNLISGQLLSKEYFEAELEADIQAFKRITKANFQRELTLVRAFMFGNQLMPAIETAFTIIVRSDIPGVIRSEPGVNTNAFRQSNQSACGCTDSANCSMSAGFYDLVTFDLSRGIFDQIEIPPRETISDWYTGCWPSETLLLSTLNTFYNQTKLNQIVSYINSSLIDNHFLALNFSITSIFDLNTTIEQLVEELFVENWTTQLNFTTYFERCRPQMCIYDSNQRSSILYIVTSLLGLYGGLSVALVFMTPYIVSFVMRRIRKRRHVNIILEENENTDATPQSFHERIRRFWFLFLKLNLFKSSRRTTSIDLEHQHWSTRIYILLLILALLFLTLYTWLIIDTKIIKIRNPSWSIVENLQTHSSTLQCPCTKLSVSYKDLISLQPTYHQICSSEYVTAKWIEGLNIIASLSVESLYYADFRFSSPMFQLLKSMCDLANDTIVNALYVFRQNQLVTSDLLLPNIFTQRLESAISQFQLTTPNELLRLLQLTRNITHMNQFLSGSYANFYVDYEEVGEYIQTNMTLGIYGSTKILANGTSQSCSCANDIECGRNAAFYTGPSGNRKVIYTVPGFYSRCFPVESLLPSTLQCFYSNQLCLDAMSNITNETFFLQMTKLNASKPSRFMINTTINQLLGELFIESWSSKLFYQTYFNQCQPTICSYIVNTQRSTLEIVTTVTGLVGGLSITLRILTPYVILACQSVFRKNRRVSTQVNPQIQTNIIQTRRSTLRDKIYLNFMTMNMFERTYRAPPTGHELFLQRQSTRLYYLLLLIALFILIIYTSLMYQQYNQDMKISSFESYQLKQKIYSSTNIDCSCTQISFEFSTFYQLDPIFHQICSSDFVENNWLDHLFVQYKLQNASDTNPQTFIGTAFAYFQSLRLMCDLTEQAVIDAENLFLSRQMIASSMLNEKLFNEQTITYLNLFKSTISNNFIEILHTLLGIAQGNGLISGYATNWGVFLPNMTKDATIYTKARIYGNCNCALSSSCTQPSVPYVPGFVVGCLPLESFLRSTFECLYNQTCVTMISSYVNTSNIPIALNKTKSRFNSTQLTNDLIEEMFIESWSYNISYKHFFQQCHPTTCSYLSNERSNILYVVTTIVGLYGGLTVLLKILIPFVVRRIYAFVRRRRQVQDNNEQEN